MSAYIVDAGHIRYLVEAALMLSHRNGNSVFRYYHAHAAHDVYAETADAVGQLLWRENHASVAYRYRREPDFPGEDVSSLYTHRHCTLPINPVEVLKAIECYEYQSCEHDGWEASAAHAFCVALRTLAISCLPGYSAAPWGAPKGWE